MDLVKIIEEHPGLTADQLTRFTGGTKKELNPKLYNLKAIGIIDINEKYQWNLDQVGKQKYEQIISFIKQYPSTARQIAVEGLSKKDINRILYASQKIDPNLTKDPENIWSCKNESSKKSVALQNDISNRKHPNTFQ